jgi:DNA-binding beta-propeller fold protein YncE
MDETSLRELLDRAVGQEPPMGPVAQNGLRLGIRLRRRRRIQRAVTGLAAAAVACTAVIAVTRVGGAPPAAVGGAGATVYVLGDRQNNATVTPISAAADVAGAPVTVRSVRGYGNSLGVQVTGSAVDTGMMAAIPGRKMIYVIDSTDAVVPVSTSTGTVGKPIVVTRQPASAQQIVALPDGKTIYVLDSVGGVTPVSTATNKPGKPIRQFLTPQGRAYPTMMAVTPDGKTLYVVAYIEPGSGVPADGYGSDPGSYPDYLFPVTTATGRVGTPIRLTTTMDKIMITPDSRTVYAVGLTGLQANNSDIAVTPIATDTNMPGKAAVVDTTGYFSGGIVMTPDGEHIYIATAHISGGASALISFATASGTVSRISFGGSLITALAAAPDSQTVYVGGATPQYVGGSPNICPRAGTVTPVATATGKAGHPVKVGCHPLDIAVTPDSKTVYVGTAGPGAGLVTPISAATARPGKSTGVVATPDALLITP